MRSVPVPPPLLLSRGKRGNDLFVAGAEDVEGLYPGGHFASAGGGHAVKAFERRGDVEREHEVSHGLLVVEKCGEPGGSEQLVRSPSGISFSNNGSKLSEFPLSVIAESAVGLESLSGEVAWMRHTAIFAGGTL